MSSRDYYPHAEGDRVTWFDNFASKLAANAGTLGIAATVVTQTQADATTLRTELSTVESMRTTLGAAVKHKQEIFSEVEKRMRDLAVVIKRNANYNESIGADLGILPIASPAGAPSLPVPEFQVVVLPDRLRLDWIKGHSDGIIIQCKRASETDFTDIGTDNVSPFEDERACVVAGVPEIRIYRIRYIVNDVPVGPWSSEIRVLFVK